MLAIEVMTLTLSLVSWQSLYVDHKTMGLHQEKAHLGTYYVNTIVAEPNTQVCRMNKSAIKIQFRTGKARRCE